jgi:hypothetical protein
MRARLCLGTSLVRATFRFWLIARWKSTLDRALLLATCSTKMILKKMFA